MPPSPLPRNLLAIALSLSLAGPALAAGPAAIIPEDFEALMEGQTEYLDVSVLGQRLGMFAVTVRPDTVTFEDPDAVVDALLGSGARLDDAARATLASLLASRLSTHESLACSVAFGACGYVATEGADVILDRQRGALALFLRPDWLARKPADPRLHLPSGDTENALIHRQSALYASGRGFQSMAVNGNGAIGLTDSGFAGFDWRLIQQRARDESRSRWDLRSAYVRQDIARTHYVQAGRMDMRNLASPLGGNFGITMQPFPRMEGVRVGTTQAYVNREAGGRGSPVTVILTQPARVDAYRGEELLGSSYLPAGFQTIDTSSFPVGSYPVTLRVVQNGAEVRSETTPFVREGGRAAQLTGVEWFAQAGHALYEDDTSLLYGRSRVRAAQAGVRVPLARGVAIGNSLAFVGGRTYDEARLDAWVPLGITTLSFSAAHLVGSDGARGQMQQLSFGSRVNWSLYRYRTTTEHCVDGGARPLRGVACSTSISATVSTALAGGQVTLGYTRASSQYRRGPASPTVPDYPWLPGREPIEDAVAANRSLSASYSRVFSVGRQGLASVGINGYRRNLSDGRRDHGGFLTLTLTRLPQRQAGLATRVQSLGTQVSTPTAGAARATLRAAETRIWQEQGYRELGMQASGDDQRRFNAAVNGRYDDSAGRFTALLAQDKVPGSGSAFSASAGYTSAFALSRSGFFLGADAGGSDPAAAVSVYAKGNKEAQGSVAADVMAPSMSSTPVRVGQKRLIAVGPFEKTVIETRDAHTAGGPKSVHASLESGAGPRPWFLTPGKLGRHVIESRLSLTYVGRLKLPTSTSHATPRLLNAVTADVDESGAFVAEFDHRPDAFYAWRQGEAYLCRTGNVVTRASVSRADITPCKAVSVASLPESVREKLPVAVATAAVAPAGNSEKGKSP